MALERGSFEAEGWRLKKDGFAFWANVALTALYDEEGMLYGYAKVTKDITEKRKAETYTRFLATIADSIQDPVISTDSNLLINKWNESAEALLEWKAEEVIAKETAAILKPSIHQRQENKSSLLLRKKGIGREKLFTTQNPANRCMYSPPHRG